MRLFLICITLSLSFFLPHAVHAHELVPADVLTHMQEHPDLTPEEFSAFLQEHRAHTNTPSLHHFFLITFVLVSIALIIFFLRKHE